MKNKSNYNIATFILILVTILFLASYPFRDYFAGGLLSSLFGAAMIGGIADWFGITALFRKPLGIPFRTRIIPRSREKIFDSLVYMVEKELLTEQIIADKLHELDFSRALVRYIEKDGGKKDLSCLLKNILQDFVKGMDRAETERLLSFFINNPELKLELSQILIDAARWSVENGYEAEVLNATIPVLKKIVNSKQLHSSLEEVSARLLDRVGNASADERGGRGLALKIIFSIPGILQFVPGKLADGVVSGLDKKLTLLKTPKSRPRKIFIKKSVKYLSLIEKDGNTKSYLDSLLINMLKKLEWDKLLEQIFPSMEKGPSPFAGDMSLDKSLEGLIDVFVNQFKQNRALQESFNNSAGSLLSGIINEKHGELGRLVREQLETYSDDDIVNMVESKAGNDLQIIRINGSVVGGLIGALSFLIIYCM